MDFGVHVFEARRREWVKSRSQVPCQGGALRMGREERQGLEGIKKELRLKRVNRQQMILRAVDVEKLIEPEHPARAIGELVGGLDLSAFRAAIEVVEGEAGRP